MIRELGDAVSRAVGQLMRLKAPESLPALAMKATVDRSSPVPAVKYPAPPPLFRDQEKARAVLRIEIDRQAEYTFFESANRIGETGALEKWRAYRAGELKGPMTFLGVAIYFVESLPAPGWRVVNPLEVR